MSRSKVVKSPTSVDVTPTFVLLPFVLIRTCRRSGNVPVVVLVQKVSWPVFCRVSGGVTSQSLMVLAPVVLLKLAAIYGAGVVAGVGVGYGVWSCAGNTLPLPWNQLVEPTVVLWFCIDHADSVVMSSKLSTRSQAGAGGVGVKVGVNVGVGVNVFVGEAVGVLVAVAQ